MADIAKFVEEIKGLTVMELADLVKAIEEEFGVSAAAPVMVAGPDVSARCRHAILLHDGVWRCCRCRGEVRV